MLGRQMSDGLLKILNEAGLNSEEQVYCFISDLGDREDPRSSFCDRLYDLVGVVMEPGQPDDKIRLVIEFRTVFADLIGKSIHEAAMASDRESLGVVPTTTDNVNDVCVGGVFGNLEAASEQMKHLLYVKSVSLSRVSHH